jgi:hypothetical protein
MPVDIDTPEAPAQVRVRCHGTGPSPDEQASLRRELIAKGLLTDGSVNCSTFASLTSRTR